MKWIKTFCYLLLMLALGQLFLSYGGLSWQVLIDLPSMLMVLAGLVYSLGAQPLSRLIQAFAQALGLRRDPGQLAESNQIVSYVGRNVVLAGGIGTLLGVIQALGNLGEPQALAAAFAISLLCLFYAAALQFLVFYPLQLALERQQLEQNWV